MLKALDRFVNSKRVQLTFSFSPGLEKVLCVPWLELSVPIW